MDVHNNDILTYPTAEMLRYLNENIRYLTMPESVK